eukprot:2156666-Pleurochrysis_carterae.AAC.1
MRNELLLAVTLSFDDATQSHGVRGCSMWQSVIARCARPPTSLVQTQNSRCRCGYAPFSAATMHNYVKHRLRSPSRAGSKTGWRGEGSGDAWEIPTISTSSLLTSGCRGMR